jgi:hypothetical protein
MVNLTTGCLLAQDTGTFDQLTLTVESDREEVLPLEPLPVTLTLANETTTSIRCVYMLDPRFGDMWFEVAQAGQPFEVFFSSDWGMSTGATRPKTVEPGFRQSASGYLYCVDRSPGRELTTWSFFPVPGTYLLKAVLPDRTDQWQVESNTLRVQVVEPTGLDAEAYRFMRELPAERSYRMFLVTDYGSKSNEVRQKQEQFFAQFPTSRYAHYIRFALGNAYIQSRDTEDLSTGIRLLEQAVADNNDIFAFQSLKRLLDLARQGGDPAKADEYRGVFAQKFPNSTEAKDYLEEPNREQREAEARQRYRELQERMKNRPGQQPR